MSHHTYSEVITRPHLVGDAITGRHLITRQFLVSIRASHRPDHLLLGDGEPLACYLDDDRHVTISDELVMELHQ